MELDKRLLESNFGFSVWATVDTQQCNMVDSMAEDLLPL